MKFAWKRLFKKVHSNDHNLIGAMEEIVEAKANLKRRKEYSPFRAFPDVASVRIEVSVGDPLFQKYGLKRRSAPGTMHYVKYHNKNLNRFKLRMINRLREAATREDANPKVYGTLVMHLLCKSRVFFLDGLRHVNPHFHRNMKFMDVLKLGRNYRRIAWSSWPQIDYSRVYILKNNKKDYRGLGVPTLVGRIYLHLINQFLVLKFEHLISPDQHGFRPFKGTLTAGIEVLKNIKKYNYIYEIDYKGFFPNLDVLTVTKCLVDLKVPYQFAKLIETLNKSLPKLPKELKIDESATEKLQTLFMGNKINNVFLDPRARPQSDFKTGSGVEKSAKELKEDQPHIAASSAIGGNPTSYVGMGVDLSDFKVHIDHHPIIGLPQGAPTSPFLSILVLDGATKKLNKDIKGIRYADDALLFSNKPIELEVTKEMREANIKYAPEKSGYVKKEGNGVKRLKFLGLVYEDNQLYAETRNGSTLLMDKESLIEEFNNRESDYKEKYEEFSGESFIRSKLAGYVQSRLYSGSGQLEDYFQDFRLKYGKGSGVHQYLNMYKDGSFEKELEQLKINIFNSSSICLKTFLEAMKDYERFNFRIKTLLKGTKKEYKKVVVTQKSLAAIRKFMLGL